MKNEYSILLAVGAALVAISLLRKDTNKKDIYTEQIANQDENMQVDTKLPRGYRNNNPLNIRISSSNWQGEVTPNTDGVFEQFSSMAYGYRAAMVLIKNYITKYGCNTLAKIIKRWAPEKENNTSGYIKRVCDTTGFSADEYINPYSEMQMTSLMYAMSLVENGTKIKPDEQAILNGWKLYIL